MNSVKFTEKEIILDWLRILNEMKIKSYDDKFKSQIRQSFEITFPSEKFSSKSQSSKNKLPSYLSSVPSSSTRWYEHPNSAFQPLPTPCDNTSPEKLNEIYQASDIETSLVYLQNNYPSSTINDTSFRSGENQSESTDSSPFSVECGAAEKLTETQFEQLINPPKYGMTLRDSHGNFSGVFPPTTIMFHEKPNEIELTSHIETSLAYLQDNHPSSTLNDAILRSDESQSENPNYTPFTNKSEEAKESAKVQYEYLINSPMYEEALTKTWNELLPSNCRQGNFSRIFPPTTKMFHKKPNGIGSTNDIDSFSKYLHGNHHSSTSNDANLIKD